MRPVTRAGGRAGLRSLLIGSASLVALAVVGGEPREAQAQGASALMDEVVVTARRREESLVDVPISVSAFSGDQLERQGFPDITDLSNVVPNLTLEQSRATSSTLTAFIRGVGQQDPLAGFEQGVGIYLDDVYLNRPQAAVLDVYDVERIEVLRGPQGTLYGRNTIGGAVKYVTRRLAEEPELSVKLSGGSYSQLDAVVTASAPISDQVKVGATAASFQRAGYGENLFTGDDHYNKELVAFRGTIELAPHPDVFIRLSGDYSDDDSNPKSGHRLTVSNLTGAPVLDDEFDTRAGIEVNTQSSVDQNEVIAWGLGAQIEWQASDAILLKSITSYRQDDTDGLIDFDSLPSPDFDAPVVYENWQFSQELQAQYEGERLNGVVGFYYLQAYAANDFDVILGNLGVTAFTGGEVDTDTWSVFADFTYDVTDQLAVSLGGRWTSDTREATVLRQTYLGLGSPALGAPSSVLIAEAANFTAEETFDKFTPRVSASYAVDDNLNLYASYSQGFKSGGFDPRGDQRAQVPYDPEIVDTFEVGLKGAGLADGRVNANLAWFYSDYTDQQIPGSVGVDSDGDGIEDTFVGTVTNAGSSTIWGIEFEGAVALTDRFTVTGMLGYINAEFDEFLVGGVNLADQRVFQNTPEWQFNLSPTYEIPDVPIFGRDGYVSLIGAWNYRSSVNQFEIPNELLDQDAVHTFNASLLWESEDGAISAGLHGRNLSDERIKTSYYNFPTLGLEGVQSAFYSAPRTVTGTLTLRF